MAESVQTLAVLAFLVLIAAAGCTLAVPYPAQRVVYPAVVPLETGSIQVPPFSFSYGDSIESIVLPIDASVYFGAKYTDKNATLYGSVEKQDWLPGYYAAFMFDPAQEEFFSGMIGQMRGIRDRKALDGDEYLEVMTAFAQSIPYRTDNQDSPPRYPIETFADRGGDCDDKSLLLAGLLAREGYNVSLFYFEPEEHMAVGVAGPGCSYRGIPYAYIETTQSSPVGVSPRTLAGGIPLDSEPLVIRVGNGSAVYGRCGEIRHIEAGLSASRDRLDALASEIALAEAELPSLLAGGNLSGYLSGISRYNALLGEYSELVKGQAGIWRRGTEGGAPR
ncbi:MAG: hypothetical protein QMC96_08625 [Methanomicrobiales archaeon]|nr:hypothetical protein [Methanomicrobiales archaeon]